MIRQQLRKKSYKYLEDLRRVLRLNEKLTGEKLRLEADQIENRTLQNNLKALEKVSRQPGSLTVPAYVLSGFLGSGKTTIMAQMIDWAVENGLTPGLIINEFGSIGIDGAVLAQEGLNITELSNGCICCTAQLDLIPALITMALNPKIDLLLVEATGLADPAEMLDKLTEPVLWKTVEVGGIITVVDSKNWPLYETDLPLARRQVEFADALILSKCDLTITEEKEKLQSRLRELAPKAAFFEAANGKIREGAEELLTFSLEVGRRKKERRQQLLQRPKLPTFELTPSNPPPPLENLPAASHRAIHSLSFEISEPLNLAAFENFLRELPPTIYRSKGFVRVAGDETPYLFQQSPGMVRVTPYSPYLPVTLRAVFIGQALNEQEIQAGLVACLAD